MEFSFFSWNPDTEDDLDANIVTHELALKTDFENFMSENQFRMN